MKIYSLALIAIFCSSTYAKKVDSFSSLQDAHEVIDEAGLYTQEIVGNNIRTDLFSFESSGCSTSYSIMFTDKDRSGNNGKYLREISIDWTRASVSGDGYTINKLYVGPVKYSQYTLLNGWKLDPTRTGGAAIWYVKDSHAKKMNAALDYLHEKCKYK